MHWMKIKLKCNKRFTCISYSQCHWACHVQPKAGFKTRLLIAHLHHCPNGLTQWVAGFAKPPESLGGDWGRPQLKWVTLDSAFVSHPEDFQIWNHWNVGWSCGMTHLCRIWETTQNLGIWKTTQNLGISETTQNLGISAVRQPKILPLLFRQPVYSFSTGLGFKNWDEAENLTYCPVICKSTF